MAKSASKESKSKHFKNVKYTQRIYLHVSLNKVKKCWNRQDSNLSPLNPLSGPVSTELSNKPVHHFCTHAWSNIIITHLFTRYEKSAMTLPF